MENATIEVVRAIITRHTLKSIPDSQALLSSHLLDSMSVIEVIVELEDSLNTRIEYEKIDFKKEFDTIEMIANYMNRIISSK
mgnify:CR=1 FL=1